MLLPISVSLKVAGKYVGGLVRSAMKSLNFLPVCFRMVSFPVR